MDVIKWHIDTNIIEKDIQNGLVIDGLKNINEIQYCKALLTKYNIFTIDIVLILSIDKETAIHRLNNR
jgi:predicted nuclease with TOPRIM domain